MPRHHFDGFDHNADNGDDGDKSNAALMQKEVSSRAGEESSIEMCGEAGFEVSSNLQVELQPPSDDHDEDFTLIIITDY